MSGVYIRPYQTDSGRRYQVRYRAGGRAHMLVHLGSFPTLKLAQARRDFAMLELASGRDPCATLRALQTVDRPRTIRDVWDEWETGRIDVRASTQRMFETHRNRLTPIFGKKIMGSLTADDVQAGINQLHTEGMQPGSIRRYLATLAQVLDHGEQEPNPCRSRKLRYPRREATIPTPPTAGQVDRMVAACLAKYRLPFRVGEQTGMRIGEIVELRWGDVDEPGCRIRVAGGKTPAARRLLEVPGWLMADISALLPREDRTAERKVFPGMTTRSAAQAMARACTLAGVPHMHPHDLRHRFASVMARRGVPRTDLARMMGHSRPGMLDVYEHVLLEEEEDRVASV
jgi:integrase